MIETNDLKRIFGRNLVMSFVGGSVANGTARKNSDIDLFVCVRQRIDYEVQSFRTWYFDIHAAHGRPPDGEFPGEVVTEEELHRSLSAAEAYAPSFAVEDATVYDGLVWAGLLAGKKLAVYGRMPDAELRCARLISRWNKELLGTTFAECGPLLKRCVHKRKVTPLLTWAFRFAQRICKNRDEICHILSAYESYETVQHELFQSFDTLTNIDREALFLNSHVKRISVFLPVNLPLYSLVLFCLVPSFVTDRIVLRAPAYAHRVIEQLWRILVADDSGMELRSDKRADFVHRYAFNSDVVLFTGMFDNVRLIMHQCPDALIVYNGPGVNPIVVNEGADLEIAARLCCRARLFNSGQDCAGPDAVLVHDTIYEQFAAIVRDIFHETIVGPYGDPNAIAGSLINPNTCFRMNTLFAQMRDAVTIGGRIDVERNTVWPTVIEVDLTARRNYQEFFAPVMWLSRYRTPEELQMYFEADEYTDYAMYASIFGSPLSINLSRSVVLYDKTVFDVEQGNTPYGGYGRRANFVCWRGSLTPRPILISREISKFLKPDLLEHDRA